MLWWSVRGLIVSWPRRTSYVVKFILIIWCWYIRSPLKCIPLTSATSSSAGIGWEWFNDVRSFLACLSVSRTFFMRGSRCFLSFDQKFCCEVIRLVFCKIMWKFTFTAGSSVWLRKNEPMCIGWFSATPIWWWASGLFNTGSAPRDALCESFWRMALMRACRRSIWANCLVNFFLLVLQNWALGFRCSSSPCDNVTGQYARSRKCSNTQFR